MTIKELKDKNLILLECISGSRAFGLATAKSDTDIRGVFYLPRDRFYGLDYIPQVSNETNDEVYYELGRFVELLIKNNPNILELLATPEAFVLYRHPLMLKLDIAEFLSGLCKETFGGYAITQIRKARGLNKKIVNPMDGERKTVLDFCFVMQGYDSIGLLQWLKENGLEQSQCGLTNIPHAKGLYALFYDAEGKLGYKGIVSGSLANEVSLSSIPAGEKEQAYLSFNQDGYSAYCKDYREYQDWVEKRNEERYLGNKAHGKDYDAKNMMHTIRLLQVTEEILLTGELKVERPNRDELLNIKAGKLSYDDLIKLADDLMLRIEKAAARSTLPAKPDHERAEQVLIAMRGELYS